MIRNLLPSLLVLATAAAARAQAATPAAPSAVLHVATQPASYWPAPLKAEPELKAPPPVGPVKPTWDSVRENYQTPEWFKDAKFGIFIHWGLYSVPAQQGFVG